MPTSPTRFRGAYGFAAGIVLAFRLEEGRTVALTVDQGGKLDELKRVP